MPPYKKNVSKAQQRLMFALEARGKLAPGEAEGKAKATARQKGGYKALPARVRKKGKK